MIRRLFWLGLGAALGVSGYRRASVLARGLIPPDPAGRAGAVVRGSGTGRRGAVVRGSGTGRAGAVVRRTGALSMVAGAPRRPGPGPLHPASLVSGARKAMRFAADVREGMQLYMERHPRRTPNTLESQRVRRSRPPARPAFAGRPDHEEDGR